MPNNEDPSGGGLFDPLLKLVGLKKNEQISEFGLAPESNHLQVNYYQVSRLSMFPLSTIPDVVQFKIPQYSTDFCLFYEKQPF